MLYRCLRPLLFAVDAERAHHAAIHVGQWLGEREWARSALERLCKPDPRLRTRAMGLDFPSPLGVAAGFDKNAVLTPILQALGFGFVEVGTVTPRPWAGNPKPRIFRLPGDEALINRLGLPNAGAANVAWRLRHARRDGWPVGVNVGRVHDRPHADAVGDFVDAVRAVRDVASYITLNVSCPNTEGGLSFEADLGRLDELLAAVERELRDIGLPWAVKLSPDSTWQHLCAIVERSLSRGACGFVLTNTTRAREDLSISMDRIRAIGSGGLSGRPLRRRANLIMRLLRRHVGEDTTLIGVGGLFDAADVMERLEAGANLVQMYTGLVYGGPFIARHVNGVLADRMGDTLQPRHQLLARR